MKQQPNTEHLLASVRQLGVILAAAGLIAGVLENANALYSAGIAAAGLTLMWIGSLED